jgi:hypothetical protein
MCIIDIAVLPSPVSKYMIELFKSASVLQSTYSTEFLNS